MKFNTKSLAFLRDIKNNNNKEWFDENKPRYVSARDNFSEIMRVIAEQIPAFDKNFKKRDIKDHIKVFRIYRDARFSRDKTRYKTNLGGHITYARDVHSPGYYLHIEPNNSFIGGGIWHPERMALNAIRDYIAENHKALRKIIENKEFKEMFGELGDKESLKTIPRGFEKDHPAADLLRHKNFVMGRKLPNSILTTDKLAPEVIKTFKMLAPFNRYILKALAA